MELQSMSNDVFQFLTWGKKDTLNFWAFTPIVGIARRVYVCQKLRYRFVYWTAINTGLGFCLTLRYKN
jgi:hypothetical protein